MSEAVPDQGYYDKPKAGDERSLYADMIRSRDYADERAKFGMDQLCSLEHYWKGQLDNPERSARARIDIGKLVVRTSFEIDMRQAEYVEMNKRLAEEDAAWDEYARSQTELVAE